MDRSEGIDAPGQRLAAVSLASPELSPLFDIPLGDVWQVELADAGERLFDVSGAESGLDLWMSYEILGSYDDQNGDGEAEKEEWRSPVCYGGEIVALQYFPRPITIRQAASFRWARLYFAGVQPGWNLVAVPELGEIQPTRVLSASDSASLLASTSCL